jgi:hypothetical protein
MKKLVFQSAVGLAVVIATFIGGTALCEFCIPGTVGKYLTDRGQVIVGTMIFVTTLALALLARFRKSALFITAGLVPAFIVVFAVVMVSRESSSGIYWPGLVQDTLFASKHTALPVLLSAVIVLLIRLIHAQPCAAPNGGPATRSGDSNVMEGPPSVS